MYRAICFALAAVAFGSASPDGATATLAQDSRDSKAKKPSEGKKPAQTSMTGCVDQQDGRFVLLDDRTMEPVAGLVAEGFPNEGFAKHVGQKVIVRGTVIPGEAGTAFKVRSIETLSSSCTPQAPHL